MDFRGQDNCQTHVLAFVYRARPTRVPSALYQEQSTLGKVKMLSGLERSDRNK